MGLYKRGKVWWCKFQVQGREIRVSTGCRSKKAALRVEARLRDQIAQGNWGIIERQAAPVLGNFLKQHFQPWAENTYQNKRTKEHYLCGARQLLVSNLASIPMDQITSEHTSQYISDHRHLTNAGINQGFRALRRALSLALEWGKIQKKPKIIELKANSREQILSFNEEDDYLEACEEPWKTIAIIMLDSGCRPDEVMNLQWEKNFDLSHNTLKIIQGKSKSARRELYMSERVIEALNAIGIHETGFVFPALSPKSVTGHISQSQLHIMHQKALRKSGVREFDPYTLRHTCLTRMGEYTPLPTLKVIAGHSRIEMTMRYVHPTKDAVERAFKQAEAKRRERKRAKMKLVKMKVTD